MKVLQLAHAWPRNTDDPFVPYLQESARLLVDRGVEVHALVPHAAGLATTERMDGVTVHRFRYAPGRWESLAYDGGILPALKARPARVLLLPAYLLAWVAAAVRLVKAVRPDLVHAHWWLPAGVVARLVAARLGVPYLVTSHGTDVVAARSPLLRRAARWVLHGAEGSLAVSQTLADELFPIAAPTPVDVVRMPLSTAGSPTDGPPPVADGPPWRAVAVGRLSPEKGFDVLLDALALARRDGVELTLRIVGEGPEEERLRAQAADLGIAEHVEMVGPVAHHRLAEVFADVHVAVAPSRREGLGLAALDAIAAGRPVIASRVGGLPEAVIDGVDGVLVVPGDPFDLAAALSALPLPPPRGDALAAQDPDLVTDALVERYRRAVAGSAGSARPGVA